MNVLLSLLFVFVLCFDCCCCLLTSYISKFCYMRSMDEISMRNFPVFQQETRLELADRKHMSNLRSAA